MRFIPLTPSDRQEMLEVIGVSSVDDLFEDIPSNVRLTGLLDLPGPMAEPALLEHFESLASRNNHFRAHKCFLGAGAYAHHVPSSVDQLIMRSELFTAYTPYQPEVSQGTLMAIYEFQTYVAALFGTDIANASMYDGASSLAEAVIMAQRITKRKKTVISNLVHPNWREVTKSYTRYSGAIIEIADGQKEGVTTAQSLAAMVNEETASVVIQHPNFFGNIEDLKAIREVCDEAGAMMIAAVAEPMALGLLEGPGKLGADIVVGEGRSFGNSISYGGPALGLFSTKDKFARQMPGRLVGKTRDVDGKEGYVLTLSTREQHIRRERATSNICSNQALCATAAAIHLSLLGKTGLKKIGIRNLSAMKYLIEKVSGLKGFEKAFGQKHFNEAVALTPVAPAVINERLAREGIVGGLDLSGYYPTMAPAILFCATEIHSKEDIDRMVKILSEFES
ncbi:Glycine dehydrogenase [decarboxylating] (glycine cleavage system P1 protein) [hydrothermal vent metagenome]|uniref:glycine dehydrogenase (aminomethyl-transferring) n=1 Tax=hydrothermal vent metagenome TaxID=652676 RepID=A0A3B1CI08_9ZZZZ